MKDRSIWGQAWRWFGVVFLLGGSALSVAAQEGAVSSSEKVEKKKTLRGLSPKNMRLFNGIALLVKEKYVDPVNEDQLMEAALTGMLASLDPYSTYLNEKQFKEIWENSQGSFSGVGTELIPENGTIRVVSAIDDTPAFRADIRPGDVIVEVDGEPIQGLSFDEVIERFRGRIGTEVRLKLTRPGQTEPLEKIIRREKIEIYPIKWEKTGDIAYVRVKTFNDKTVDHLAHALEEIKAQHLKGIILDLRNNPGGVFEAAVGAASIFLGEGKEIVSIRERAAHHIQKFTSSSPETMKDVPIVILVNNGTASSAEVFTGALQDNKRALVLGVPSIGKGSIQTLVPISPGYTAVRLTTGRYYTPSGYPIQGHGITPNILVEQTEVHYSGEKEKAQGGGAGNGAPENAVIKIPGLPAFTIARGQEIGEKRTLQGEKAVRDPQLARALDILKGLIFMDTSIPAGQQEGSNDDFEAANKAS